MLTHPLTPNGATFLGRGELIKGRGYLEFKDLLTNGNFTVPEKDATEASVALAHRQCRERFAGSTFAPVS